MTLQWEGRTDPQLYIHRMAAGLGISPGKAGNAIVPKMAFISCL